MLGQPPAASRHQVLTHHDDRAVVNRAADRVRYIAAAWPGLRVHVDLDDPAHQPYRR